MLVDVLKAYIKSDAFVNDFTEAKRLIKAGDVEGLANLIKANPQARKLAAQLGLRRPIVSSSELLTYRRTIEFEIKTLPGTDLSKIAPDDNGYPDARLKRRDTGWQLSLAAAKARAK